MAERKHKVLPIVFVSIVLLSSLAAFSQENPYLLPPDLLKNIQNDVSGERAWDMLSKISGFHRIRGAGEGSDYDLCVEWLA
jgi:hypothetical protein